MNTNNLENMSGAIQTAPLISISGRLIAKNAKIPEPDFSMMTKSQLYFWALENFGIDIPRAICKKEMISTIKKHLPSD